MGALFEESWLESELDRKLPYFLMQIYAYTDYQIRQKLFPETKLALWRREAVFFGATVDLLTSDSPCHCGSDSGPPGKLVLHKYEFTNLYEEKTLTGE
jgi:hypothetical protein